MFAGLLRARRHRRRPDGGRPRRRIGCFGWVLLLLVALVVLLILSVMFGGFQKGTRAGLGQPPAASVSYQP